MDEEDQLEWFGRNDVTIEQKYQAWKAIDLGKNQFREQPRHSWQCLLFFSE